MPKKDRKKANNTLGAVLARRPNKTTVIYLTSENAAVLANSVVVVKDGSAHVFKSSSVVDDGDLATSQSVSTSILQQDIIPNASKLSFSMESGSARLRILQMHVGHVQKVKNSCKIVSGRRK